MTPERADECFAAWRDSYFKDSPGASEWRGTVFDLEHELGVPLELLQKVFHDLPQSIFRESVIYPGGLLALIHRPGWNFSFSDPAPPVLSAPIPFPAGAALLELIAAEAKKPKCVRCGSRKRSYPYVGTAQAVGVCGDCGNLFFA